MRKTVPAFISVIIGALLATATIIGLVSSQLDQTAQHPGDINRSNIPYGQNN